MGNKHAGRGWQWCLRIACVVGCLCCLAAGLICPAQAAAKVVARVNGEAITEAQLQANMPADQFAVTELDLRSAKLERLISAALVRQFLTKHHVTVPERTVDAVVAELTRYPPSSGCSCCRYASLAQFMEINAYSMDELRAEIRNDEGLTQYLRAQWQRRYPTRAARLALINAERAGITKSHVYFSQIFFNTFQLAEMAMDPERVEQEQHAKAQAAWQRLRRGEAFAAVARAVSEDMMSREAGGKVGLIRRDTFGDEVKDAIAQLKPGHYSQPIPSLWGYHIIQWRPVTDAEVLQVHRQSYMDAQRETMLALLRKAATIERITHQ